MAWQPDEQAVGQVVAMLEQAQTPDSAVQAAVTAQLDQLQTVPEFNQTVAHVFIRLTDRPVAMRMAAGLILKNNVRRHIQTMPPAQAAALKAELLAGIGDGDSLIRKTVGTCISTFAKAMGTYNDWLIHWPELMPTVSRQPALLPSLSCLLPCSRAAAAAARCLGSCSAARSSHTRSFSRHVVFQIAAHLEPTASPSCIGGALDVLHKISEDVPDRMVADDSQPLGAILPKVFALLTAADATWRAYSLGIINQYIMLDPPVMQENMAALLQAM